MFGVIRYNNSVCVSVAVEHERKKFPVAQTDEMLLQAVPAECTYWTSFSTIFMQGSAHAMYHMTNITLTNSFSTSNVVATFGAASHTNACQLAFVFSISNINIIDEGVFVMEWKVGCHRLDLVRRNNKKRQCPSQGTSTFTRIYSSYLLSSYIEIQASNVTSLQTEPEISRRYRVGPEIVTAEKNHLWPDLAIWVVNRT